MAEHAPSSSNGGPGFILLFFGGIIAFWIIAGAGEGPGIFGDTATSTEEQKVNETLSYEAPREEDVSIDDNLAHVSDEVRALRAQVKEAKIWGTVSPFAGTVAVYGGDTANKDEDEEYLTLYHNGSATVSISGWTLESYVTGNRARIPTGSALARMGSKSSTGSIMLAPGESATITSGESPVGTSFKENRCTGYFEQYQDFAPSLSQSCPYPQEEMEEYGDIALDDDRCYDFVATLSSCEVARAEAASARISASCESFVKNDLTYSGCVLNHAADSDFNTGTWRIFLGEDDDLWRNEREIIRLLDGSGRTVDVLQY